MKKPIVLSVLLISSITFAENIKTFKAIQAKDSDFMPDGPDVEVQPGCSWYCAGNVSAFLASSELKPSGGNTYIAKNAHDFNVKTAWVEGKDGYGKGEYLEYTFDLRDKKGYKPGITKIILANGYKKSKKSWSDNSRLKKIKMYVDNKPYAILELLDSFEFQTIQIGKIMLPQDKIMKFKFEILDVYPGAKYKDTAISELLFAGTGVH